MKTHISTEQYQSILNYVEQTELVKELLAKEIIDTADLHTPDSEEGTSNDEENENPYLDFDTWITLSNIETITNAESLEKKGVPYIDSEYGFWIGISYSSDTDSTIKRITEIIFDYELSDKELKKLKEGDDLDIKKVVA